MNSRPTRRLLLFGGALAGLGVTWFPFMQARISELQERLLPVHTVQEQMNALKVSSVLFLDPCLSAQPDLFRNVALNPLGIHSSPLAIQSRPEHRPGLAAAFPERNLYQYRAETGTVVPLATRFEGYVRDAANTHLARGAGRNLEDGGRVAEAEVHQPGLVMYGWYPYLPPGEFECRFDLRWTGGDDSRPVRIEVMSDLGRTTLVSKVLSPGLEETVLRFRLEEITRVEPRVYYGGSGSLLLRSVDLVPVPVLRGSAVPVTTDD
jgi:hypothetical protein